MSDILAVGPHPDDIELSPAGRWRCWPPPGARWRWWISRRGRGDPRHPGDPGRRGRRRGRSPRGGGTRGPRASRRRSLPARPDQMKAVVEVIRRHRPRLLIGLHWNDDHPDHIEAGEMVRRAAYLAGLGTSPSGEGSPSPGPRALRHGTAPVRALPGGGRERGLRQQAPGGRGHEASSREPGDALVTRFRTGVPPPDRGADRYFGGMIGARFGEPFFEGGPVAVRTAAGLWRRTRDESRNLLLSHRGGERCGGHGARQGAGPPRARGALHHLEPAGSSAGVRGEHLLPRGAPRELSRVSLPALLLSLAAKMAEVARPTISTSSTPTTPCPTPPAPTWPSACWDQK